MNNGIRPGAQALLVDWNGSDYKVTVVRAYSGPDDVYPNGSRISLTNVNAKDLWWVHNSEVPMPVKNMFGDHMGAFTEIVVHKRHIMILGDPGLVKDEKEQLEKQNGQPQHQQG